MINVNEYLMNNIILANDAEAMYTAAAKKAMDRSSSLASTYMSMANKASHTVTNLIAQGMRLGLL